MLLLNGKVWNILTNEDILKAINEIEESFFFEFKEDEVKPAKLIEEISAFANTYGGYIFLGVTDDKTIKGCKMWNEQRIFSVIHDSISPIPSFDVKKFQFDEDKEVYILRVDEGAEPPYITNKGMIYERISSSSCVVKDSNRLSQMFVKRKEQEKMIDKKISIKEIEKDVNNIWGYIDVGFSLMVRNTDTFVEKFYVSDVEKMFGNIFQGVCDGNVTRIGNSLIFSFGGLSSNDGKLLPAHLNNFVEIMADGSVRLRMLLLNNDPNNSTVNMALRFNMLNCFEKVYLYIFKDILEEGFIYAKKYEKLCVIKQFNPIYDIEEYANDFDEKQQSINKKMKEKRREHINNTGKDLVITDDRIPKDGYFIVDKKAIQENEFMYNADNIAFCLFHSRFLYSGYIPKLENVE